MSSANRSDPFALPPATDAHFTLLIVSVIGASFLLYEMLFNNVPAFWDAKVASEQRCAQQVATLFPGDDIERNPQRIEARAICERPVRLAQAGAEAGGCALLLAVAAGLYWWLPGRTLRRRGLTPFGPDDDPELVRAIDDLAAAQGLTSPPSVVCNVLNRSAGGVAFGHLGRRYLGLYGGTVLRLRRDPELFRTVVLHELAHLRNADLDKASLAVTVWWAFVAMALAPAVLAIVLTGSGNLSGAFGIGWRTLALGALVLLTRSAVLRSRELYADQRLVAAGVPSSALERALAVPARGARGAAWSGLGRLRRALAYHPSAAERVAALDAPRALFHFSRWTAFGAGMAATVAASSVSTWVYGFLPPALLSYASFIAGLLMLTPLAWVIAVSMWRAESDQPISASSSLFLGLALGGGFYLGSLASLATYAAETSPGVLIGFELVVFELALAFVILVSLTLFVAWVRTTARAWLPFSDPPRRSLLGAALGASVVLVLWYAFISFSLESGIAGDLPARATFTGALAQFGFPSDAPGWVAVLLQVFAASALLLTALPLTPLVIALIWALPLSVGVVVAAAPRTRWLLALIVSVIVGAIACPFVIAALFVLGQTSSIVGAAIGTGLTLAGFQVLAGVLVMARASTLRGMHGLMAAHLSGVVSASVLALLSGGVDVSVMLTIWTGGTLLSAPVVLGIAPLVGLLRREQPLAASASAG